MSLVIEKQRVCFIDYVDLVGFGFFLGGGLLFCLDFFKYLMHSKIYFLISGT